MEAGEVYKTENGYYVKIISVLKGFPRDVQSPILFPAYVHMFHDEACTDRYYGGPICYDEVGLHTMSDAKQNGKFFTQEDVKHVKAYKLVMK